MCKLSSLIIVLFALTIAAFGTGCESDSSPALSVSKAEPTERTPDGCAMLFTIDARNDNEEPLPLRTVEYRVDLNGREVFSGTRSAEATLRRLGTQQIRLPAVVVLTPETQSLAAGTAHYRLTGSMYYVTPGRLAETLFDSGVHTPSVGFTFEGEIDLSRATFMPAATPSTSVSVEPPSAPSTPK